MPVGISTTGWYCSALSMRYLLTVSAASPAPWPKPPARMSVGESAWRLPSAPVAWVKTYSVEGGPQGRVFTTTMGSSTDLAAEGTRRMLVNAVYWTTGLEDKIPEKSVVDIVGTFEPTPFGFNKAVKGLTPASLK